MLKSFISKPYILQNWEKIYFRIFLGSSFIFTPIIYNNIFFIESKKTPATSLLNSFLLASGFGALWPITIPYSISLYIDGIFFIYKKK